MQQNQVYNVVGLMSGTSLDGLDVCNVLFTKSTLGWSYQIIKAQTYPYSSDIRSLLNHLKDCSLSDYLKLDQQYSQFVSNTILSFISTLAKKPSLISSHGHTVFHQPTHGITFQCCNPSYLAATTGIDCVGNFRQLDVFRGGQGAPLVPYGAELFPQYDCFLNIGGIVNVDWKGKGWDIGFGNMVGNHYIGSLGKEFDNDGEIGSNGMFNQEVWDTFIQNYKLSEISMDKSFGRQDFQFIVDKIDKISPTPPVKDILFTHYKFITSLITKHITTFIRPQHKGQDETIPVLCTGGGVYNKYLMELLSINTEQIKFVIPDKQTIEFKEAIVFGFLGVKFLRNQKNCARGVGGVLAKGTKFNQ